MNFGRSTMAAVALVALAAVNLGAIHRDDRRTIQGSWSAVAAERDGRDAGDVLGHKLVIDGDGFAIYANGETIYEGTVVMDPARDPHEIDFKQASGSLKGKTWRGIYKFKGDTLCICDNAGNPAKSRPAQFATRLNSGFVSIVFKRINPRTTAAR